MGPNTNINLTPLAKDAKLLRGQLAIRWLGQAGFLVRAPGLGIGIDLYLSDSLAAKYRNKPLPHIRLMPPPVDPGQLTGIDWLLCTHTHTDHMDAATLLPLIKANPQARIVAPRAQREKALLTGIAEDRFTFVNAGETIPIGPHATVHAVPAAHETLTVNPAGEYSHLGYILEIESVKLYHSGDCVPYDGLAESLKPLLVDLALLPVNGRDDFRTSQGILGNFTFDEAVNVCRQAGIGTMIAHHWGMFDFNTVDPDHLRDMAQEVAGSPGIVIPDTQTQWLLQKDSPTAIKEQ